MESLMEEHPELRTQIENLLKQIGIALPINSLYIDLTNDEKMDNDSDGKATEVVDLLKNVASAYAGDNKSEYITTLLSAEPFCNYSEEITVALKRGEIQ